MQTARFFSYSRFIFLLNPIKKKKILEPPLMPIASKVATSVHSHTIKIDESKVATNQSSKVLNLIFKGILHSRIKGSLATNCYQRFLWILVLMCIVLWTLRPTRLLVQHTLLYYICLLVPHTYAYYIKALMYILSEINTI